MLWPLFERFTEEARAVLSAADGEARRLRHRHLGVEHILLGLLQQQDTPAVGVLSALGVDSDRFRARVIEIVPAHEDGSPPGGQLPGQLLPFSPRAKKVLEFALRETLSLGMNHISTEMLLLGLARDDGGVALEILVEWDVSSEQIRNGVLKVLPDHRPVAPGSPAPPPPAPGDVAGMLKRFTERAREAVVAAQQEARVLRTGYVGSEALLLGLLRVEEGLAAQALASFDVTLVRARAQVVQRVRAGENVAPEEIPFTPRAKEVLERALEVALEMGHNYVGTEHVLLGIAEVDEGVAIAVLRALDVDSQKLRAAVIGLSSRPLSRRWPARRGVGHATAGPGPGPEAGFRVQPGDDVRRILMNASARALEDGRTEMIPADLLIALSRAEQTGPLLARLGAGEAAIRAAFKDQVTSEEPPEAAAGS
jgi:ATP-dependent Clp protease ATP-binding subunit ClpA